MPQQTVELIEGQQITVSGVTIAFEKPRTQRQGASPPVSVAVLTITTPDPDAEADPSPKLFIHNSADT